MRTQTFALLGVVLFLSVSSALATGEVQAFLELAQSSPFGKTLMGTIELELSSNAPGDYLIHLLEKMRAGLVNDITIANKTHFSFQAKCTVDLTTLKNEVRLHAAKVIESKKLIQKASRERGWTQNQRENAIRQLAESKDNYAKITKLREVEAEAYEGKIRELNDALKVLHEGRVMIEKGLKSGSSFIEVSTSFDSYIQKVTGLISNEQYHGRGYVSVISSLVEIMKGVGKQAKQSTVNRVLKAIQAIIDQLEQAKNLEYRSEQERISNFETLKNIYDKSITGLTELIQKLTTRIASLKNIIRYNKQRVAENTRAIEVKKRLQIKTRKECQVEQRAYNKANKKRQSDLNLIAAAQELINQNVDAFRNIVLSNAKDRIAAAHAKK